jgi:plastocyanin
MRSSRAASLAVLALLAGCGGEEEAAEGAPRSVKVNIAGFEFTPDPVTLRAGGTIAFVNRDKAVHNAESPENFNTVRQKSGDEKRISFEEPGTYDYFCRFHRFMTGTVRVLE